MLKQTKQKTTSLKTFSSAFTLVEVLVAMAILMMLIGSMVSIEVMNIKLANSGKRQLQATGLARGALNLVRTIRDTSLLEDPTGATVFDGLTADSITKHLEKKAIPDDNQWQLCTNTAPITPGCTSLIQTKQLDSTTYTVEVTIE